MKVKKYYKTITIFLDVKKDDNNDIISETKLSEMLKDISDKYSDFLNDDSEIIYEIGNNSDKDIYRLKLSIKLKYIYVNMDKYLFSIIKRFGIWNIGLIIDDIDSYININRFGSIYAKHIRFSNTVIMNNTKISPEDIICNVSGNHNSQFIKILTYRNKKSSMSDDPISIEIYSKHDNIKSDERLDICLKDLNSATTEVLSRKILNYIKKKDLK